MSKHSASLKYIFKIRSSRLRKAKWNLTLSIEEAMRNEEIVTLADSTALRFISEIEQQENQDQYILSIRNNIQSLKMKDNIAANKNKVRALYKELYEASFISSYLSVVIDNNQDYDRLNSKKGFYINGIKYRRLLATTSGAKNSTVVFVNYDIYDELIKRIDNGRNMNKPFVPARLEAYKSLVCSTSTPVPHPSGIVVVNDCETSFLSHVIEIDDSVTKKFPKMRHKENYGIKLNESDGYGLILPSLSEKWAKQLGENYIPSGFCIRNAFANEDLDGIIRASRPDLSSSITVKHISETDAFIEVKERNYLDSVVDVRNINELDSIIVAKQINETDTEIVISQPDLAGFLSPRVERIEELTASAMIRKRYVTDLDSSIAVRGRGNRNYVYIL